MPVRLPVAVTDAEAGPCIDGVADAEHDTDELPTSRPVPFSAPLAVKVGLALPDSAAMPESRPVAVVVVVAEPEAAWLPRSLPVTVVVTLAAPCNDERC